jgi:hypothetical protein
MLTGAHNLAIGEGHTADTAAYFARVEKILGIGVPAPSSVEPPPTNGAVRHQAAPAARHAAPVAPVTSSAGGFNSGDRVQLTPGEQRACQDGTLIYNYDDTSPQKRFKKGDPIGLAEMARRKRELQKRGAYDRNE